MSSKKSPVKAKAGKVRFHEEVKVKKIKAKGRGLPVNTPVYWEEEMGEEFEGFGDEDGMLNGHSDLDHDYEDSEEDDDDDDDDDDEDEDNEDADTGEDEDEDDEDSEEDYREVGQKGRQAVERLKGDLFAEDSEEESEGGKSGGSGCDCC